MAHPPQMPPAQRAAQAAPPSAAYQAAILEELRKIRVDAHDHHRHLVSTLIWLIVGIPILLVIVVSFFGALISP